ncbi:MAG TPA: nodulation protein NfeD [Chloroflexota bacterium]|nr:nodulation protein NfeD [Chloroflexota bacterium]
MNRQIGTTTFRPSAPSFAMGHVGPDAWREPADPLRHAAPAVLALLFGFLCLLQVLVPGHFLPLVHDSLPSVSGRDSTDRSALAQAITPDQPSRSPVFVADVRGIINPVMAGYVTRVIDEAETAGASLVVLEMDTPGGLDTSMREITQRILAARVPVAVFVYPPGSRAASAGVFITYSAHIAAMAPSTNIGSAHPVSLGSNGEEQQSSTMVDKITNDAVASIRSMAELRGRNADWAEEAVRTSANLQSSEALKQNVVDVIADDLPALLRSLDGRSVHVGSADVTLNVADAPLEFRSMNGIERFFHTISDPTVAYLLLSLGGLALIYELASPGAVLPGVVGGISVLLALYSLGTLPINMAGVGLILFALVLLFADLAVAGSGVLTVGGILSFLLGSMLLATAPQSQAFVRVSAPAVVTMSLAFAGFFTFVVAAILRGRRRPVFVGIETLPGARGVARSDIGASGTVLVDGELWQASAADPDTPIPSGSPVRVVSVSGLRVVVRAE